MTVTDLNQCAVISPAHGAPLLGYISVIPHMLHYIPANPIVQILAWAFIAWTWVCVYSYFVITASPITQPEAKPVVYSAAMIVSFVFVLCLGPLAYLVFSTVILTSVLRSRIKDGAC